MKRIAESDRIRSLAERLAQRWTAYSRASGWALAAIFLQITPVVGQGPGRTPLRRPLPRVIVPARQAPQPAVRAQPSHQPQVSVQSTVPGMTSRPGPPAPIERPTPPAYTAIPPQSYPQPERPQHSSIAAAQISEPQNHPLIVPNRPGESQQHLAGWMEAHRSLPLAEQQRALENEPGFHSYPVQEQQRMRNRLTQLNAMPQQQRQKVIQRTEAMEQLAPPQRQQVRNAMAQLGNLPEDRRHVVSRTFYQLRDLPPQQRQAYMNTPQFRGQFTDQERGAINGLLDVTPIYPPLQGSGQPR